MTHAELKDKILSYLHRRETPCLAASIAKAVGSPLVTVERALPTLGGITVSRRGRSHLWKIANKFETDAVVKIESTPTAGATAIGHEELAEDMTEKVESLGIGDRAEDYPDGWLDANRPAVCPTEDSETFRIVRIENGYPVTLGEISEIDLKDRARYQITSPWEAKSYGSMSEAIAALVVDEDVKG